MEVIGLSEENIRKISEVKHEEQWILDYRLKSFELANEIKCLPSKFEEVKTIAPNEYFEGFFVAKIIKL